MNRTKLYVLGGVLIMAFAGFSLASFRDSLTPYVSYDQARTVDRVVQVAGGLVPDSTKYDQASQSLRFTLDDQETGETLRVSYDGVKPGNFEDAISIVAIGRWDEASQQFHAEKLLVKCPSKYQGVEEKQYG